MQLISMFLSLVNKTRYLSFRVCLILLTAQGDYGDALVKDGVLYGMFAGAASSGFCTSSAKPIILADISAVASWVQATTNATFTN